MMASETMNFRRLQDAERFAADRLFCNELAESLDEPNEVFLFHIGNQHVILLALAEERVRALLGGIDFDPAIHSQTLGIVDGDGHRLGSAGALDRVDLQLDQCKGSSIAPTMAVWVGGVERDSWIEDDRVMINILFSVVVVVFLLKILWNLLVPCILFVRSVQGGNADGGISLMPAVEILLLAVLVTLSFVAGRSLWLSSASCVALGGGIAIIGSYVHMVTVGAGVGWLAQKIKKRKLTRDAGSS